MLCGLRDRADHLRVDFRWQISSLELSNAFGMHFGARVAPPVNQRRERWFQMVSDISIPIFNMFNYTWVDDPQ
jgi:hypothetical protein